MVEREREGEGVLLGAVGQGNCRLIKLGAKLGTFPRLAPDVLRRPSGGSSSLPLLPSP